MGLCFKHFMKNYIELMTSVILLTLIVNPSMAIAENPFLGFMETAISSKDEKQSKKAIDDIIGLLYEGSKLDKELIKRQYVEALKLHVNDVNKVSTYSKAIQDHSKRENELSVEAVKTEKDRDEKIHPVCVYKKNAGVTIYYVNGMFNSEMDVVNSVAALEGMVSDLKASSFGVDNQIKIRALYNENEPVFHQLAQVTKNKLGDTFAMFWDYYYYLDNAPEWFKRDYFDLMIQTVGGAFRNDEIPRSFNKLGERFGEIVFNGMSQSGVMPIIIGHSQGGLYVNAISRYLSHRMRDDEGSSKYYGTLALGSPVGTVHSALGGSLLRDDDFVMKLVRIAVGTKKPDYKHLSKSADRLQHNFVEAYLKDSKVRRDFISSVQEIFSDMTPHSANKTYGAISLKAKCDAKDFYGSLSSWLGSAEVTNENKEYNAFVSCQSLKSAIMENDSKSRFRVQMSYDEDSNYNCELEGSIKFKSNVIEAKVSGSDEYLKELCLEPSKNQIKVSLCE